MENETIITQIRGGAMKKLTVEEGGFISLELTTVDPHYVTGVGIDLTPEDRQRVIEALQAVKEG